MIARWALVALALLLPLDALAESCNFTTTGNWTSATAYSGTVTGCSTLSADDNITIDAGVTVTVTTGSTVSMTIGAIIVNSGGSLVVAPRGNLAIPDAGLTVNPGGTFTPRGSAISYGDATPALVSVLSDGGGADVNTSVPVGRVIHCPGVSAGVNATSATAIASDCAGALGGEAGTLDEMALCWPDATVAAQLQSGYDLSSGVANEQQFYSEWVAQVAAGDVLVFWDSTNKNPSRDVNAQYEVAWVNQQPANRCIGLSVRQGTTETSCATYALTCHLAERDITPCTVTTTAYAAGARSIQCDAAAITTAWQKAGRNLTCPADKDRNGTVEVGDTQSVTIVETTAADVLRLMPGGMPYDVPVGSLCHIDYGWKSGDEVSVYKPAQLTQVQNATCGGAGSPVSCCGGANWGICGSLTCGRGATCDFDFTLSTRVGRYQVFAPATMDNTWIREASSSMQIMAIEGAGPFNRLQLTSPASDNPTDNAHGISVSGGGTSVFNDLVFRHWGDDAFCPNQCTVASATSCPGGIDGDLAKTYTTVLKRARMENEGCRSGSCGMFDDCTTSPGGKVTFDVTDLLAVDAHERILTNAPIYDSNQSVAGLTKLKNTTMVASGSPLAIFNTGNASRLEISNFYDIGRTLGASNSYYMYSIHSLSDASLIEPQSTGAGHLFYNIGTVMRAAAGAINWSRVLMLDVDFPGVNPTNLIRLDSALVPTSWSDIAVISPNRTGQADANVLLRLNSDGASTVPMRFNRLTIAMRPGETTEYTTGWYTPLGSGSAPYTGGYRTMSGALAANFYRASAASLVGYTLDAGTGAFAVGPHCDVNNSTAFSASWQTALSTQGGAVRDLRQDFVDPGVGNFTPVKGSLSYAAGCGARNVGAKDMWALRVLGHNVNNGYGDTWKVKGGATQRRGPRATP